MKRERIMDESGKKGLIKAGRARAEREGVRRQKLWDPGRTLGQEVTLLQDLDDPIDNRRDGLVIEMAGAIKNQVDTGRKSRFGRMLLGLWSVPSVKSGSVIPTA